MAYDNKGGASKAMKYFNDQFEARRAQMLQKGGSVDRTQMQRSTVSRDKYKKYHRDLQEDKRKARSVGKTEVKKEKTDRDGNVKKIKYKRPNTKSIEPKKSYDNKMSFKKKKTKKSTPAPSNQKSKNPRFL